jgi:ribosomal protein S18 acetylase RimI-like enzyme
MPTIRPATESDLDALAQMWRSFMKDQQRFLRSVRLTKANVAAMRAHLAKLVPHGQVLVAEVDGALAGYTSVVVNLPSLDTHYASATISDLWVEPAYRGHGLGKSLMQAAVAKIRDSGLHAASLKVATGNDSARALYRALGFRSTEETMVLPLDSDYVRFGPQAKED